MRKKITGLIALALIAGAMVVPASPAKADSYAGVGHCVANLPAWPLDSGSGGSCSGGLLAAGVGLTDSRSPVVCAPTACTISATVDQYQEPCLIPGEPPLIGTANGTLTITANGPLPGSTSSRYNWVRVGLTAVLLYPETAGVAAFVPLPPLGSCGAPLPLNAHVVGIAASAP